MTVGNGAEGQAHVSKEQAAKDNYTGWLIPDSDGRKKTESALITSYENSSKSNPLEKLKSNQQIFAEYLTSIDKAAEEAERLFDQDLALILRDFEQYACKRQKQAICNLKTTLEKTYYEYYYYSTEKVRSVLNTSLQTGLAAVTVPLYENLNNYIESKILDAEECFVKSTTMLAEKAFRKTGDLFGLTWQGHIEMPSVKVVHIDNNISNELTIGELLPDAWDEELPDSIIKPLMLQEIKVALPVEMEIKYQVLRDNYQKHYRKTAEDLKNIMRARLNDTKDQLKTELDTIE